MRLSKILVTAALALAATGASAEIVNVASVDAANPGAKPSPTVATFGPGTYTITPVGTADGGQYDGWRVFNSGGYDERYSFSYDGNTTSVWPDPSKVYDTLADALAAYKNLGTSFTLDKPTEVSFQISDSWYYDNAGGVSLNVAPTAVPEPSMLLLFAAGVGAILFLQRRRVRTI